MSNAQPVKKENLLANPFVRVEVVATLYKLIPANPVVAILVTILLGWQVIIWPKHWPLITVLAGWVSLNLVYLSLYVHYQKITQSKALDETDSALFLKRFFWVALLDAIVFGWVCALVYWARPEMYAVATVGCAIYLFGDVFKNTVYAKLTNLFPFVIFGPLAATFLYEGTPVLITLAIILLISIFAMLEFSRNIAYTLQLAIKQRFDITRQHQELALLTQKLAKERERADAANAAKSNFFTAASHDARQPLQVISLLFQALKESSGSVAQNQNVIAKIETNLKSIRTLFDRVLDVSRIDSGHVRPSLQNVNLQALFDRLDAQFGELAATKGLWLRFVPSKDWVRHDPELLDRMVSNLIHNAIKYTERGGVWIAWRATRKRMEIRDSGLGIAEQDQETIFEEFAQLNNPSRNNEAGLGLGLSIVKRLAGLSGTSLGLSSKGGRGSCFWLGLNTADGEGNASETSIRPTVSMAKVSLEGLHILYADDEPQLLELIGKLLRDAGATVHTCVDVAQAKAVMLHTSKIDIVLTDYRLGEGGNGLDLVKNARSITGRENQSLLPAIFLTGDTAAKNMSDIRQLQHCTLLHKPINFEDLAKVLHDMVYSRH